MARYKIRLYDGVTLESFLFSFEDEESWVRVEFFIHSLELLDSHRLEPT